MSIGTDDFVPNFVAKTCRDIIDDVEKLDVIQDGFIHYQLHGLILLLRDIHSKVLTEYICKEGCVLSQTQTHVGSNDGLRFQDGDSQKQDDTTLTLPQLNRLHEVIHCEG